MQTTIHAKGKMVIPAKARKMAGLSEGDLVNVEAKSEGQIVLTRIPSSKADQGTKAKIILRKGTHPVGSTGRIVTSAQIRELLNDF